MNGVGNIVLLATEQVELGSEHDIISSSSNSNNKNQNNQLVITSSSNSNGNGHTAIIGSSNNHPAHQQQPSSAALHQHHHHHLSHLPVSMAALIRNGGAAVVTPTAAGATSLANVVVQADEELTPLTWLHDKNLLKGINLSKVPVSSPDSPRQAGGGHLSPTSDFVEDSSVSEDNTSSANSSSDQSIGVFCTETIHPNGRSLAGLTSTTTHHHTFQLANGSHKTVTINGDTIIELPVSSMVSMGGSDQDKDQKSPSSTASCGSSASPPSSASSQYNSSSPSPVPSQAGMGSGQYGGGGGTNSGNSTPVHQHFHKRYLREEHVKQQKQVISSFVTPVKQQSSAMKLEDGEIIEDRYYPSTPIKNGYAMMTASPNVSGDDYPSNGYGLLKPPSPPLSPQQMNGTGSMADIQNLSSQQSQQHLQQSSSISPLPSPIGNGNSKLSPPKAKHPTNVPYDPLVHIHNKPPYSFSSLIFMAIENCQQKALPVKEIYAWIVQHFPYFKTAPTGWKNSVRHNLSLNKCFQKVEKAANLGKGSLWMVEPQYRPNLVQALSRSPFHAGSGIDKTTYKAMQQQAAQQRSTDSPTSSVGSSYSKDTFPYLTSRLAPGVEAAQNGLSLQHLASHHVSHPDLEGDDFSRSSTPIDYDAGGDLPHHHHNGSNSYHAAYHLAQHGPLPMSTSVTLNGSPVVGVNGHHPSGDGLNRDWSADTLEDVNAATAMLALKHGPKIFAEAFHSGTPPVITTSPSEDHTYSAGRGVIAPPQTPPSQHNHHHGNQQPSHHHQAVSNGTAGYGEGLRNGGNAAAGQCNGNQSDNGTSSDAAYESSEESQHQSPADDLEEERRQAGVDALLNLAGITSSYPGSAPTTLNTNSSLKRMFNRGEDNDEEDHHQPYPTDYQTGSYAPQQLEGVQSSSVYSSVVQQQSFRQYYAAAGGGTPDDLSTINGRYPSSHSPSPPQKKSKPSLGSSPSARMLKKLKKKATWAR
ncbi:forkhead box protein biniou isoform X2 [Uranotaenia lowii]|uniref:forkhead box protein biniou isoform X2 n=1 Tax=Uranotaenia lowii TaxID=190385 RepID=UPI0024786322|nr:forkhead box protein biniou isoform X2 [Uranotaenia lowii]